MSAKEKVAKRLLAVASSAEDAVRAWCLTWWWSAFALLSAINAFDAKDSWWLTWHLSWFGLFVCLFVGSLPRPKPADVNIHFDAQFQDAFNLGAFSINGTTRRATSATGDVSSSPKTEDAG